MDTLCNTEREDRASCGGEDSSYDSDYEAEDLASHHDVSRTVSDTLGAEFAEYVSGPQSAPPQPPQQGSAGTEHGYFVMLLIIHGQNIYRVMHLKSYCCREYCVEYCIPGCDSM